MGARCQATADALKADYLPATDTIHYDMDHTYTIIRTHTFPAFTALPTDAL